MNSYPSDTSHGCGRLRLSEYVFQSDSITENKDTKIRLISDSGRENCNSISVYVKSKDPRLKLRALSECTRVNEEKTENVDSSTYSFKGLSAAKLGLSIRLASAVSDYEKKNERVALAPLNDSIWTPRHRKEETKSIHPQLHPEDTITTGPEYHSNQTRLESKVGSSNLEDEVKSLQKAYLTLEEYEEEVRSGKMQPYSGKSHPSAKARYSDGWVIGLPSKRWVKLEKQVSRTLVTNLALENEALRKKLRDAVLEKTGVKAPSTAEDEITDKKIKEVASRLSTVKLAQNLNPKEYLTADFLLVLDTNCFLRDQQNTWKIIKGILSAVADVSVLVPREVYREIDRKKVSHDENLKFRARESSRLLQAISEIKRQSSFPPLRGQSDSELYVDEGYHRHPTRLRGDDSILNCCLHFQNTLHKKVILCTNDRGFIHVAKANGIVAESLAKLRSIVPDSYISCFN